jgi:membrane protein DedA with SNARE-associated domain
LKREVSVLLSSDQIHYLFAHYGVWTVAFIVGLESLGLPLPGETILILASVYAATHDGNIATVIAAAIVGAVVVDNIGYALGRGFGYPLLLRFGPYVGLTEGRIKLGQYLFLKHGGMVVFFGRFFAVLRFLAAFLAGVNRLAWPRFLLANALGGVVWATAVGLLAYTLDRDIHRIQGTLGIIAGAIAVCVLGGLFVYLRRNESKLQADAEAALPGPLRERFQPRNTVTSRSTE